MILKTQHRFELKGLSKVIIMIVEMIYLVCHGVNMYLKTSLGSHRL